MIDSTATVVGVQISWAVITAYGIQWLKRLSFIPFVNFDTENLNRFLAILCAVGTSSGIGFIFNRTGPGIFSMAVTGISVSSVYHLISGTVQQFALQHAVYKGIIAPPLAGPIQQVIRRNGGDTEKVTAADIPPALGSK